MKRTIVLILCLAAMYGCRYTFELQTYGLEPRLAVRSEVGAGDSSVIFINKALSVNMVGKEDGNLSDVYLRLTCNGKEVAISKARTDETGFRFDVGQRFSAGDEIRLTAMAEDMETAEASTFIPEPFPAYSIDLSKHDGHIRHMSISYKDDPLTEDWYAASIEYRFIDHRTGFTYDGDYVVPDKHDGISMDPEAYIPVWLSRDGDNMFIWKDTDEADDIYDIFFMLGSSTSGTDIEYRFRCRLYRLSEEMYYRLYAEYDYSENPFVTMGLFSPSFTYTNIRNGVGYFHSYNAVCSEWMIENMEDDK